MTGPKCSNSSQAALLLGLPIILLKICVSSAALDALAARGMRLTRVTHGDVTALSPYLILLVTAQFELDLRCRFGVW